ncbi:MAG: hypothetical protein GXP25_16355 [Planctomycetes bacterium]|nr:hypothetical protein [Planctomycetota bacterium]
MEHFSKSLFWKMVSVALVAGLFYVGYSISKLADSPVAHAAGKIEVNLAEVGGSHCFGAIPVKIQK